MTRRLLRDDDAGTLAEFALVLPLLLTFLFGIIDGGRYLYAQNQLEKATQMGARMAAVTSPVVPGIVTMTFSTVTPGEAIPASALSDVVCRDAGDCQCTGNCPALTRDDDAFTRIYNRMKAFYPPLKKNNIEVVYRGSGLGYAGDPNGIDVQPIVSVRIRTDTSGSGQNAVDNSVKFQPLSGYVWGAVTLPSFESSLTAEDLAGNQSN